MLAMNSLIDIDHYWRYWTKFKFTLNPFKVIKFCSNVTYEQVMNDKEYTKLTIFHTIEFIIFVGIISVYTGLYTLFIGIFLHVVTDIVDGYRVTGQFTTGGRTKSFILWLYKVVKDDKA